MTIRTILKAMARVSKSKLWKSEEKWQGQAFYWSITSDGADVKLNIVVNVNSFFRNERQPLMCSYIDDKATNHLQNVPKDLESAQKSRKKFPSVKCMTPNDVTKRTIFPCKMDFYIIFYVLSFLQMVNIAR